MGGPYPSTVAIHWEEARSCCCLGFHGLPSGYQAVQTIVGLLLEYCQNLLGLLLGILLDWLGLYQEHYENSTRLLGIYYIVDRVLPIFRTFLGDLYYFSMLLFEWLHVFFPEIDLRRNWIIKEVVLVEASSILPLPRRLESY